MSSRRPTNPGGLPYGDIVNLQGSAGNKAVAQMLAKLGPPADGVATFQRIYVARRPTETVQRRDIPLTADDVADLKRVGTHAIKELAKLEQERAITTVDAEQGKKRIEELMRRSKKGRGDRNALIKELNHLRAFPALVRKRAAAGRSTKGKKVVTDFKLTPAVIRVGEGEAARISFVVEGTPQSISAFIFEDPNREGTAFRIFNMAPTAGYHQVIWDGTFSSRSASRTPAMKPSSRGSGAGSQSRRSRADCPHGRAFVSRPGRTPPSQRRSYPDQRRTWR